MTVACYSQWATSFSAWKSGLRAILEMDAESEFWWVKIWYQLKNFLESRRENKDDEDC